VRNLVEAAFVGALSGWRGSAALQACVVYEWRTVRPVEDHGLIAQIRNDAHRLRRWWVEPDLAWQCCLGSLRLLLEGSSALKRLSHLDHGHVCRRGRPWPLGEHLRVGSSAAGVTLGGSHKAPGLLVRWHMPRIVCFTCFLIWALV